MHKCPGPGCDKEVPDHMLMCAKHWYKVPSYLRTRVWRAYQNGAGAGSDEYRKAILEAITSIGGDL